jgi:hypothetical protein
MRVVIATALLVWIGNPSPAVAAVSDEDDPKMSREREPVRARSVLPDEDDPKLARGAVQKPAPRPPHPVPRFKLAYRRLVTANIDPGDLPFNVIELDFYPSSGLFRFGLDTEVGIAGNKYSMWFLTTGANIGFQWPARVTPFVEGRFVAGLIGGSFEGITAVSWLITAGLDTGLELYYARRFYITASIGWAHPIFSGVDINYVHAHPKLDPERKIFSNDSFTFKVGLGL